MKVTLPLRAAGLSKLLWTDLGIPATELRPHLTLNSGQCFNWKRFSNSDVWVGILDKDVPVTIKQTDHSTLVGVGSETGDIKYKLTNYFQLSHSLHDLYNEWSSSCKRMNCVAQFLPGLRVIDQDPWECLISFICSSNNNIKRIISMLEKLRVKYGAYICSVQRRYEGVNQDEV